MKTPFRWLVASVLTVSSAAPVVLAPAEAHAEWAPVMHRSDAGADLYLWSARIFGTTLAPVPFVQFDVTRNLYLNMRFPVAMSIGAGFDDSVRAGLGNPTFAIFYSDVVDQLTWYAGGRVGAPLGLIDDNDYRIALLAGALSMGLYDAYLWVPDTIPFGGMGGMEYRFADFFVLRAGGDLMFYPPVRSRRVDYALRSRDFDVALQTKVEGEFQSDIGVGGGMALLAVWLPTYEGDNAQISALPYFVYDSQETFFMRAGGLVALDSPLGFGFDRYNVATIFLQFGGHID